MSTYIHYTVEQKEQARQTDLAALLRAQGETLPLIKALIEDVLAYQKTLN